jgi:hypothetical protein
MHPDVKVFGVMTLQPILIVVEDGLETIDAKDHGGINV